MTRIRSSPPTAKPPRRPRLTALRNDELIIDNFAGGGGASHGIHTALGRPPDVAINHNGVATSLHHVNHPYTRHYVTDVWDTEPTVVTRGRPVGLAWFSPDCTHFSKARGGKPVKKTIRGLAWVALRWAAEVRPRVIVLENVEEFVTWGPLTRKRGREKHPQPCRYRKGRTFRKWCDQLEGLGYKLEYRELRACDFGAPTIRKRFFLIARCDGQPINWPEPTHGDPKSAEVKAGKLLPWRTAAQIIDWSQDCPSIFMSAEDATVYRKATGQKINRPLAEATMARIARGVWRYAINCPNPFIVGYHSGDPFRGQSVEDPLRTQTSENRFGLVVPFTVPRYGERDGQLPRCGEVDQPLPTVTPTANGASLVMPFLASPAHSKSTGRGPNVWHLDEPLRTVTGSNDKALCVPHMLQVNHQGERRSQSIEEPLPTITASRRSHALCAAWVVKHFGGARNANMAGVSADSPFPTITGVPTQNQLAVSFLSKFYTSNTVGGRMEYDQPLHTVTSAYHFAEVRAFLAKYYGNEKDGHSLDSPIGTVTSTDRFGLVVVGGEEYQIADIGMRMLTPRELYRAQGFADDYVIDRTASGKPISKSAQVSMCGNSVSPCVARAIVAANFSRPRKAWKPAKQLEFKGV